MDGTCRIYDEATGKSFVKASPNLSLIPLSRDHTLDHRSTHKEVNNPLVIQHAHDSDPSTPDLLPEDARTPRVIPAFFPGVGGPLT